MSEQDYEPDEANYGEDECKDDYEKKLEKYKDKFKFNHKGKKIWYDDGREKYTKLLESKLKAEQEARIKAEKKLEKVDVGLIQIQDTERCSIQGCNDSGEYPEQIGEDEWERVQCEFCWTNEKSLFNKIKKLQSIISEKESK